MSTVPLLLDGQWTHPPAQSFGPVHNPCKGEIIAEVPMCGGAEVDAAVQSAQRACAGGCGHDAWMPVAGQTCRRARQ